MKFVKLSRNIYVTSFLLLAFISLAACTVQPPTQQEVEPVTEQSIEEESAPETVTENGEPSEEELLADQIAMGKAIYDQNCASCHGIDGEGQPYWKQPGANGVYPAPPHDNTGHTWHHPDSQLLQIIVEGSSVPNSAMIGYADILTEEEMVASLEYIKTFWAEREAEMQRKATERADN